MDLEEILIMKNQSGFYMEMKTNDILKIYMYKNVIKYFYFILDFVHKLAVELVFYRG